MSETTLTPVTLPRLNEPAPEFTAVTTQGEKSLADYKGKWLVLFSHPADFTPVCSTELMKFAEKHDDFKAINTELLGLSVDSIYSHIAWIANMKEKFDVEITYPMIADLSMDVARKYGMIQPGASDTSTVRCVFVIDDKSTVRAMIYYPLTNGRSVAEVYRLVKGLQTTDANGVATPEGWQPGEDVIVPPPKTQADALKRSGEGYETTDWWFSKKSL